MTKNRFRIDGFISLLIIFDQVYRKPLEHDRFDEGKAELKAWESATDQGSRFHRRHQNNQLRSIYMKKDSGNFSRF